MVLLVVMLGRSGLASPSKGSLIARLVGVRMK